MKKSLKVMTVAALLSAQQTFAGAGFDLNGGLLGIFTALNGNNPLPVGSIVQLIWSSDTTFADNTVWDAAGFLGQGDYLLNTITLTSGDYMGDQGSAHSAGGGWVGDLDGNTVYDNTNVGGQNIYNGYVYGRVYNTINPLIGAGVVYGQIASPGVDVDTGNQSTNVPPGLPQTVNYSQINSAYTDDVNGDPLFTGGTALVMGQQNVFTTVPEPSVFAFLGIGAVVLGLRRKMARS